jgi:hypothetical protein
MHHPDRMMSPAGPFRTPVMCSHGASGYCGHTVAHEPNNDETSDSSAVLKYRYRDSTRQQQVLL